VTFTIPDNDVSASANQSRWFQTDIDILAAGVAGTGVLTGCAVTAQASPDMTVAVAAGTIQPSAGAAAVVVAAGNVTIGTADATNPRLDLVSASAAGVKTVTAGTAAVAPKPPALPAGHAALAVVYVPATDTTMASNQITDKRVMIEASGVPNSLPVIDVALRVDRYGGAVSTSGDYVGVPLNMLDADDTTWMAVTGGSVAGDRWFRVDLGTPRRITSWRVSNGNRAAKLQYSRDNSTWTDVTGGTVTANAVSTGTVDIVARYWRVVSTATGGDWTLNTFSLFGYLGADVAAASTVTNQTNYVGVVASVIDGDDTTWDAQQNGGGTWWKFDLGAAKRVRMVRIVNGTTPAILEYSSDDVTYKSTGLLVPPSVTTVAFIDVTARYFRLMKLQTASGALYGDWLLYTVQLFSED
jgi:hypothetical protein